MQSALLFLILLISHITFARPAQILIVRHAEKPLTADEGIHLSDRGQARAKALADFFIQHPEMNDNGTPVAIFAAQAKRIDGSVRPFETCLPLSQKIGIGVNTYFKSGEEVSIAEEILDNPHYHGKTVVMCWVRDELPLLAYALGVQESVGWPKEVFNRVWKLKFDQNGQAKIKEIPQKLLPGD